MFKYRLTISPVDLWVLVFRLYLHPSLYAIQMALCGKERNGEKASYREGRWGGGKKGVAGGLGWDGTEFLGSLHLPFDFEVVSGCPWVSMGCT